MLFFLKLKIASENRPLSDIKKRSFIYSEDVMEYTKAQRAIEATRILVKKHKNPVAQYTLARAIQDNLTSPEEGEDCARLIAEAVSRCGKDEIHLEGYYTEYVRPQFMDKTPAPRSPQA